MSDLIDKVQAVYKNLGEVLAECHAETQKKDQDVLELVSKINELHAKNAALVKLFDQLEEAFGRCLDILREGKQFAVVRTKTLIRAALAEIDKQMEPK